MSAEPGNNRRVHLFVAGRVQGVWYRGSMQREAESRGLTGWVRNLPDGRVEAVVEGGTNQIEQLIVWCGQGPSGSRVSDVQVLEETPAGIEGFEITR